MITRLLAVVSLPLLLGGTPAEWKTFTPKGGGFSMSFPGTPSQTKQSVKTPTGFVDVTVFVVEPKKGEGQYMVSYSDYPAAVLKAGTADKRLDNARDGAVFSLKGKLEEEKKIKLDDYPGRDLLIKTEGRLVRTRIYTVKNRLYQTAVVGPAKLVQAKETVQFLDSFKLIK